jgi:hypothetical protein
MTEAIETNEANVSPAPAAKPKKKRASGGTGGKARAKAPKRKATTSRKGALRTKPGTRGVMAKAGDYAMVVRIPEALHKKMWAWAKKQDDSLSGLVRKSIERLLK